jgi:integrase/recombinase XerD
VKSLDYGIVSGLYNRLRAIAKRAGVTRKVNPHNWRHTRATNLATKITEQEMKVVLGWTAGSNQAQTYVHLSGMDINKAMFKAAGIEVEEDQEPSLLATERCANCKELNDKSKELCWKCGVPLSETVKQKQEEKHDAELIERVKKEILEALAANEKKKIEFVREPLTDEQSDILNKPGNQFSHEIVSDGILHDIEVSPEDIPEKEIDVVNRVLKTDKKE